MFLHLVEASVNVSSLLLDVGGGLLAVEEDVLDRYPGSVMSSEESNIRAIVRGGFGSSTFHTCTVNTVQCTAVKSSVCKKSGKNGGNL
jgi:hypothetical protein